MVLEAEAEAAQEGGVAQDCIFPSTDHKVVEGRGQEVGVEAW